MKGVLFNIVEEIVVELFDHDTWDDVLDAAGVDGAYTALGNYADADLVAIAGAVAQATGKPADEVWQLVGRMALPKLMDHLGEAAPKVSSARALIGSVNDIIHPEVRMIYPDSSPPVFECTEQADGSLDVLYRSQRRLDDLAVGLMLGCGDYYDEVVVVTRAETPSADDEARFVATFEPAAP